MAPGNSEHPDAVARDYFALNPPPRQLQSHTTLARTFIDTHASENRRVVLVTSGGTTVPLENQTVRFIDNFSAGTRGATSAEYFLEAGYAVIFLHRQFSLLPYSRHYSHSTNCFLDYMIEDENGSVVVGDEYQEEMLHVLRQYKAVRKDNTLLLLSFTTITDYLWELREIAKLMQPLGPRALFYLAAAVSDFFVPHDRMVEHKIQSSEDFNATKQVNGDPKTKLPAARTEGKSLVIDLDPVPKFLKSLVDGWAPEGMIVTFKLETDPSMLSAKAKYALNKYSHHLVIGNLLSTRKWEVVFVTSKGSKWIRVPRRRRTKSFSGRLEQVGLAVGRDDEEAVEDGAVSEETMQWDPPMEIESLIVPEISRMHEEMIKSKAQGR
ncbi:phosphopantothenate-cysteine ligase-like protein [Cryomyces antarcticus]